MPVNIRGAVRPPHGPALAQRNLSIFDLLFGLLTGFIIALPHRNSLCTSRIHKQRGEALSLFCGKLRIAAAPEAASHDKVPAIC